MNATAAVYRVIGNWVFVEAEFHDPREAIDRAQRLARFRPSVVRVTRDKVGRERRQRVWPVA